MSSRTVVHISEVDGMTHIIATSEADSAEEALASVQKVFDWCGKGQKRLIRTLPKEKSGKNFETDLIEHKGFVRFSVLNEAGEDLMPSLVDDDVARIENLEIALHRIAGHGNITGDKARKIASEALGVKKPGGTP